MSERELLELAADIEKNGQLEPIHTFEGYVLDGRSRLSACQLIGLEPWVVEFDPTQGISPLAFVISKNLFRRHLRESQRAMVAARVAILPQGGQMKAPIGAFDLAPPTLDEAAVLLNVGKRSVERARKVLEHGAPELIAAVDAGQLSLAAAARIAALPSDEQQAFLASPGGAKVLAGRTARTAETPQEQPLRDALGHEVPPELTDVFADRKLYVQAARQFDALSRRVATLARRRSGSGYYLSRYVAKIQKHLGLLREMLHSLGPHCASPDAQPGWLPEMALKEEPGQA